MRGIGLGIGAQGVRLADSHLSGFLWGRIMPAGMPFNMRRGLSYLLTTLTVLMAKRFVPLPKIIGSNIEDAGAFLAADAILDPLLFPFTSRISGRGMAGRMGPPAPQGEVSGWPHGVVGLGDSGGGPGYSYPNPGYGLLGVGDYETAHDAGMGDFVTWGGY